MLQIFNYYLKTHLFFLRKYSGLPVFLSGQTDSHSLCYFPGDLDFEKESIKAAYLRPSRGKVKEKLSMKDLKKDFCSLYYFAV